MKIKSIPLVIVFTLAAASAHAQASFSSFLRAAPGEQHSVDGEYVNFNVAKGESYKSDFYFSLSSTVSLSATIVINTEEGTTDDQDWLTLWKVTPMQWQPLGSSIEGRFTANGTSFHHKFINVPAGNYYYELAGNNTAQATNQIVFQSHIVPKKSPAPTDVGPVPEPTTYALLASGLGLIGIRLRRRRD